LDSICPTGAGNVAGVKIESDDEKLAGGAEGARERKMQSGESRPGINGIRREKTRKARRGRGAAKVFEQERTEKTERKNFAKNALFLDLALQKRRNCFMAHERDYTVLPGFSRCRLTGQSHGQRKDCQRDGVLINRKETCLTDCYRNVTFVAMLRMELASQPV
jgi:hypothetical protein